MSIIEDYAVIEYKWYFHLQVNPLYQIASTMPVAPKGQIQKYTGSVIRRHLVPVTYGITP